MITLFDNNINELLANTVAIDERFADKAKAE